MCCMKHLLNQLDEKVSISDNNFDDTLKKGVDIMIRCDKVKKENMNLPNEYYDRIKSYTLGLLGCK